MSDIIHVRCIDCKSQYDQGFLEGSLWPPEVCGACGSPRIVVWNPEFTQFGQYDDGELAEILRNCADHGNLTGSGVSPEVLREAAYRIGKAK